MKDFSYAQKRKDTPWYVIEIKNYEVYFWELPFLAIFVVEKAIEDWAYERRVWDDNKATKALDHILPYILEWVEEDDAYYYCMSWDYYGLHKFAPFYLKKWAAKFRYGLHQYVATDYEKDGYIKTVEKDSYGDTWVKFEKGA